jgi:glycosyltransferase involved in cell wall biosynthesis
MARMRRQKRILVLSHGLLYGGAQVATLEFLKLIKDVFDIHVAVASNANAEYIQELETLDLKISKVPCKLVGGFYDMKISTVAKIIETTDLVWISETEYLTAPRIKRLKNIPVIAHLHNYALACPYWTLYFGYGQTCEDPCNVSRIIKCRHTLTQEKQKLGILSYFRILFNKPIYLSWCPIKYTQWFNNRNKVIRCIDAFIAPSIAVQRLCEQHIREFKQKLIKVIPNPVSVPDEIIKQYINEKQVETPRITYADAAKGAITKGPHILLQALKQLKDSGLRLKTNMVGCKGTWLEKYAFKLGIANDVNFYDRLPKSEYYKLICSSTVVVVPSIWAEPFGIVALEANYLGVPVIASRIGGLSEIILNGVTGLLVNPADPEALAKSIIQILTKRFSRREIHLNTFSRFRTSHIKQQFLEFLAKAIEEGT